jgi:hypothetical protein
MGFDLSEDPETARQISRLENHNKPLLVVDVDEVVLEFVRPFMGFLEHRGFHLRTDSFRLNGNVIDVSTGMAADDKTVEILVEDLFCEQEHWQTAVEGAADTLEKLGREVAVVMLTAMPHRHFERRRRLLDRFGLTYPLLTTEAAKGPAIERLRRDRGMPVAFVDDIPHNLVSVRQSVPDAALFHLMSFAPFKAVLPKLPDDIIRTEGWADAESLIAEALGINTASI